MLISQLLVLPIFIGAFWLYRSLPPNSGERRAILLFDSAVAVLILILSAASAGGVLALVGSDKGSLWGPIWGHVFAALSSYLIVLFGLPLAWWIRNRLIFP